MGPRGRPNTEFCEKERFIDAGFYLIFEFRAASVEPEIMLGMLSENGPHRYPFMGRSGPFCPFLWKPLGQDAPERPTTQNRSTDSVIPHWLFRE